MTDGYSVEQKILLIKMLEKDKEQDKKISKKNIEFIDYFYRWKELGFYGALKEFEKTR